jgi:hypothetical protein
MDLDLLKQYRQELLKKIEEKTTWGKNELKELIKDEYISVVEDAVEENL